MSTQEALDPVSFGLPELPDFDITSHVTDSVIRSLKIHSYSPMAMLDYARAAVTKYAAAIAQPQAHVVEPVAWRWRIGPREGGFVVDPAWRLSDIPLVGYMDREIQPLYASPQPLQGTEPAKIIRDLIEWLESTPGGLGLRPRTSVEEAKRWLAASPTPTKG